MLKVFICAAALLVFGFLVLPWAIRLHLDRTGTALYLRLDGAVSCGLIGLGLSRQKAERRLHFLFLGHSLFSLSLSSGRRRSSRPPPSSAPTVENESFASRTPFALVRRLWGPGLDLLAALPRIVTLKKVHVRGRFGLDDPARTGAAFGFLRSLDFAFGRRLRIDLLPDFTRPGFQGQLDLTMYLHLGLLLLLVLRFALQVAGRWLAARVNWRFWKPGLA